MKTLEHRGQKIICQYIDDNFGRILAKKNINIVFCRCLVTITLFTNVSLTAL